MNLADQLNSERGIYMKAIYLSAVLVSSLYFASTASAVTTSNPYSAISEEESTLTSKNCVIELTGTNHMTLDGSSNDNVECTATGSHVTVRAQFHYYGSGTRADSPEIASFDQELHTWKYNNLKITVSLRGASGNLYRLFAVAIPKRNFPHALQPMSFDFRYVFHSGKKNRIEVFGRDLHRFPGIPMETSGVNLEFDTEYPLLN